MVLLQVGRHTHTPTLHRFLMSVPPMVQSVVSYSRFPMAGFRLAWMPVVLNSGVSPTTYILLTTGSMHMNVLMGIFTRRISWPQDCLRETWRRRLTKWASINSLKTVKLPMGQYRANPSIQHLGGDKIKKCKVCGKLLPLEEFHKNSLNKKDGHKIEGE